jgi:hypothetical protein
MRSGFRAALVPGIVVVRRMVATRAIRAIVQRTADSFFNNDEVQIWTEDH